MRSRSPEKPRWGMAPSLAALFAAAAIFPHLGILALSGLLAAEWWSGLVLTVVFGALGGLLGYVVERRGTASLRGFRRAVRRLGHGDFSVRLAEAGAGEWALLAAEIDQAAGNLEVLRDHYEEVVANKEADIARGRSEVARLSEDNMRLQWETLQRGKSVTSLQEFVVAINRIDDQAQIAGQLLTYLDNEVDYSIATVLLIEPETRRIVPVAVSNRDKGSRLVGKYVKDIQSLQPSGIKSAVGRVVEAGKPLLISDVEGDRRGLTTRPEIKSELAVPLKVQDKVIGVVHLESARSEAYSQQQEATLTLLANATATAIGNIRLFEEEAKVRMLREMDTVKSQLISTVSHELRTPLAAIKGYSTSLQRPEAKLDDRTRREFLQIIEEEADRLSEMIENLLDMSKIEAGVLRLHKQPVQLERIVRKVVEQMKSRAPQVRFRVRFPTDCPTVTVAHHRIEQVVRNLVENAVKYSPEGGRIVLSGEVQDETIVVSVADDGLGIPAEHCQRIFEPFYQVDSGTTRRVGGSGLGLAICRGFVEAHGGRIWVESEPGRGSTFRFSLPLRLEEDEAVEAGAAAIAADGG